MKKYISILYALSLVEYTSQQNPINVPVILTSNPNSVSNPIV